MVTFRIFFGFNFKCTKSYIGRRAAKISETSLNSFTSSLNYVSELCLEEKSTVLLYSARNLVSMGLVESAARKFR